MSSSERVPWRLRLLLALGSSVVAGALSEGMVRVLDGGGLPNLRLYEDDGARIGLRAGACQAYQGPDGAVTEVCTVAPDVRRGADGDPRRVLVGDSQVVGLGIDEGDTIAARLGVRGIGAPGWGTTEAAAAVGDVDRVVFLVNMANDWGDVAPIHERYRVVGGWLLTPSTAGSPQAAFWASPLSSSHVLFHLVAAVGRGPAEVVSPSWLRDPEAAVGTTAAVAAPIARWAAAHPRVQVTVALLPVELAVDPGREALTPLRGLTHADAARAARVLSEQLGAALGPVPLIDLGAALAGHPEAFLTRDLHLSADGTERAAAALASTLAP